MIRIDALVVHTRGWKRIAAPKIVTNVPSGDASRQRFKVHSRDKMFSLTQSVHRTRGVFVTHTRFHEVLGSHPSVSVTFFAIEVLRGKQASNIELMTVRILLAQRC